MKVGIYYYEKGMRNPELIAELSDALRRAGMQVETMTSTEAIRGIDALVVLGGDGTILPAAVACGKQGIPLVGINYGHLGFLTEFELSERLSIIPLLLDGNAMLRHRSALEIETDAGVFYALNEAVMQRKYDSASHRQVIGIRAELEGKLVDSYRADGLIVCTPTGSTAYALSAGGAILSPDLSAFMITPICAHSLRSRPMVYADHRLLSLRLTEGASAEIYCDGKRVSAVRRGGAALVRKAPFTVDFLTTGQNGFYDKLFYKMNQWSEVNGSQQSTK